MATEVRPQAMRFALRIAQLAVAATLASTLGFAPPAEGQTGSVFGKVTDDAGAALASAEVRVAGLLLRAFSDDAGRYELAGVPARICTLQVLLLGYRPATRVVTVTLGDALEVNFTLARTLLDLSVGCRNVFDVYPDRMMHPFNNNGGTFPWASASPFGYNGRYLYTRMSLTAKR